MLLSESNLLILDEPTNHLDYGTKELFQKALLQYGGSRFDSESSIFSRPRRDFSPPERTETGLCISSPEKRKAPSRLRFAPRCV